MRKESAENIRTNDILFRRKGDKEMASKIEFVEFIAEQLREAGEITNRKMFGEYGIYCNGKIFEIGRAHV